jgi:hypothetical protein
MKLNLMPNTGLLCGIRMMGKLSREKRRRA